LGIFSMNQTPTHKAKPWWPPTKSLKKCFLKGVMTNNPLPIIGLMLYSLNDKLVILFCFEYKNYFATEKSKTCPKLGCCAGWLLLGILDQNPSRKAIKQLAAVLSSFEKDANVGSKTQDVKNKVRMTKFQKAI